MSEAAKKQGPNRLIVQRTPTRSNVNRIEWDVTVDSATTVEDLLDPAFWTNVSGSTFCGKHNFVNVYFEDNTGFVRLFVRQYDSTFAKMELLEEYHFEKADPIEVPDAFTIKFTGPNTKYQVIRKSDAQIIREGLSSKEDAKKFIEEHKAQIK